MKKFESKDKVELLIQFIDGISWSEYQQKFPEKVGTIKKKLQQHFILDCLFGIINRMIKKLINKKNSKLGCNW